jgi:hypothetical protein
MYLGRVLHHGPDGPEPRIVAATDPGTGWVDVHSSERLRLQRAGSGASAACKVAAAIVPASMAAALDSGWVFLDAAAWSWTISGALRKSTV